jgi:hypothetical protein
MVRPTHGEPAATSARTAAGASSGIVRSDQIKRSSRTRLPFIADAFLLDTYH